MHARQHIAEKTGREKLDANDDQQHPQHQQWMAILDIAVFVAQQGDVGADYRAAQSRQ